MAGTSAETITFAAFKVTPAGRVLFKPVIN